MRTLEANHAAFRTSGSNHPKKNRTHFFCMRIGSYPDWLVHPGAGFPRSVFFFYLFPGGLFYFFPVPDRVFTQETLSGLGWGIYLAFLLIGLRVRSRKTYWIWTAGLILVLGVNLVGCSFG
jgi:hypothetical protein